MAKAPKLSETQITLSMNQFNRLLQLEADSFLPRMEGFIQRSKAGGMSDEAIISAMNTDFETGGQLFGGIKSRIDKQISGLMEDLSTKEKEVVLLEEIENFDESLEMWVATLINTCADCAALHGVVKTRAEWEAEGVPNVRGTICTWKYTCYCVLLNMSLMSQEDRDSITEPIKLQREKIKEYEKMRGKLSASYKTQLLGQANSSESIVKKVDEK